MRCRIPVAVRVGTVDWVISLDYYNKSHRAELVATASNGASGVILDGRARSVESGVWKPISVPPGSMRERIFEALVGEGKAVRVLQQAEDEGDF